MQAFNGHTEVVSELIGNMADVNAVDNEGRLNVFRFFNISSSLCVQFKQ